MRETDKILPQDGVMDGTPLAQDETPTFADEGGDVPDLGSDKELHESIVNMNQDMQDEYIPSEYTPPQKEEGKSGFRETLDFVKDIGIIIAIVMIVRTFFAMPFQINGQSMYESYYNGQFIIVDRLSYREFPLIGGISQIERGDVVVFAPGINDSRKYFIKRVIGLPGETLKISEGRVYIKTIGATEFEELEEGAYLSQVNEKKTYVKNNKNGENIYEVPQGHYFVMGDNRNSSTDSRTCFQTCSIRTEYITPEHIMGKVLLDLGLFSISSFSFTHPELGISTRPQLFGSKATHEY